MDVKNLQRIKNIENAIVNLAKRVGYMESLILANHPKPETEQPAEPRPDDQGPDDKQPDADEGGKGPEPAEPGPDGQGPTGPDPAVTKCDSPTFEYCGDRFNGGICVRVGHCQHKGGEQEKPDGENTLDLNN